MNEAQKKEVSDKAAVAVLADWEEGVVTGVAWLSPDCHMTDILSSANIEWHTGPRHQQTDLYTQHQARKGLKLRQKAQCECHS